jgi:RNA polymerase sigma-70 factor (ECF subfamily)
VLRVTDAAAASAASIAALEPVLRRFAFRATRDDTLAKDLAQAALTAALEAARSFEGRSQLQTWLLAVLANKIADHFRRSGREADEGAEELELLRSPEAQEVERVVAARHELQRVERAIAQLPERERLALLLEAEGVDRQAACNALGVNATHLRVLLHRGRHRLRRMLEKEPPP